MCGIFGIVGENLEKYSDEVINTSIESLEKRGPDEKGFLRFSNCILAHTRLSIVDLAGGNQPMNDSQEKLTITFNGEIYNYKELRQDLKNKGYTFNTNSDTEVILKAYQEYGHKCPTYLDGMFSFSIWDENKKELFIARDRFGKKPFYYAFDENNNFVFSSEIKAILNTGYKVDINYKAIDDYLRLLYVPQNKSIYSNIFNLPPACCGTYKDGAFTNNKYWELKRSTISISEEEAKTKFESLFKNAVRKRLVADVEIGSMLSGGVDSSIITYYAQKFTPNPIKTFSVGFENYINELPFAKEVADNLKTDHHELSMDLDIAKELKEISAYLDEPHADAAIIPTYLISKLAQKKIKVLLSGDGADELFYGYAWTWKHNNLSTINKIIQALFSNPFNDYLKAITCFNKKYRKKLWISEKNLNDDFKIDFSENKKITWMQKINLFDINSYLPGDLLAKLDRASMMTSVEVRSPFLDYKLAEFVFNLPEKFKADNLKTGKFGSSWGGKWQSKILLKKLCQGKIPDSIINRRKQGFGPPVKPWLEKESVKKLVNELFVINKAGVYGFLNEKEIKKIINDFYKKGSNAYKLWTLVCLELWHLNNKKYFKNR